MKPALAIVTPDTDPPRWTTRTPPTGLPFRAREHGEDDVVIVNPALKRWMERKEQS